jgi:hypothetical protein
MKCLYGFGAIVAMAAWVSLTPAAQAKDEEPVPAPFGPSFYGTPADIIQQEFFHDGQDAFGNMSYKEQWRSISGTGHHNIRERGRYPEISIERDLRRVNAVWTDAMDQQTMSDPFMRVPDLVNPYDTSLMSLPTSQPGSRIMGTELVYERIPGR